MKKHFNEKHDVIIMSNVAPANTFDSPKSGHEVPHKNIVNHALFYVQTTEDGFNCMKVFISKEMIIDIAKQITEIEKEIFHKVYDNGLPF